jgi:hypothetical protein
VGDWGAGLGGLLGASTGLAVSLGTVEAPDGGAVPAGAAAETRPAGAPSLALRLVLTGAWGVDAPAAADRLGAAFQVLVEDPLARLTGLDHPLRDPATSATPDALALDVALDPVRMVTGVRAAMTAPVAGIMAF